MPFFFGLADYEQGLSSNDNLDGPLLQCRSWGDAS